MENSFEKCAIALAAPFSLDLVDAPGCPREHRRIHIAEIPLVSGDVAVWMLIPLAHDQIELALGKCRIDQRQWNAMKGKVPRRIPGKFPLIRHRHDTLVVKMTPLGVAPVVTFLWRRRKSRIAFEPLLHDVVIELLAPKHSGQRLALNRAVLPAQAPGCE